MKRRSGVLLHVSSLWGDYSIGSLGKEAKDFVDFLFDSGFSIWQTLPFCITDEFNSPYKSPASFSFNPYFIDLPTLFQKGYITESELLFEKNEFPYLCNFSALKEKRLTLLFKAAKRALAAEEVRASVEKFIGENPRINEAAEFLSLLEENGGLDWQKWTKPHPCEEKVLIWQFLHYEFFTQWMEIKKYANGKGVKIIGDVPIYVSENSADLWASPENFLLDRKGYPTEISGVPPDYFSPDGQLWGNPLYDYKKMKKDGFSFWRERIRQTFRLFDGARLDHFRGFDEFWSIPAKSLSAGEGKWKRGEGRALLKAILEESGEGFLIAEDLGDITDSVKRLLSDFGLAGMRVFEFAFLGDAYSPHLPHNYIKNCVAYSGTHDNNTLLGYLFECENDVRARIFDYCGYRGDNIDEGARWVLRTLLASSADTVFFPIQDILGFGSDTRMNTPGTSEGNWGYRLTESQILNIDRGALKQWNELYGRI